MNRRWRSALPVSLSVAVMAATCTSLPAQSPGMGDMASADKAASFAAVSDLLDRRCAACHNKEGAAGAGDLDLEPDAAYAMLMRKSTEAPLALVSPGEIEKSYIVAKLTGNQSRVGGWGDTMPAGQGQLPPAEIELVRRWIAAGAQR
jgi:mono/diheme cytochrome c family protein